MNSMFPVDSMLKINFHRETAAQYEGNSWSFRFLN